MEAGRVVDGRFEIERLAGSGGMGAVYCARDRRDGGRVALKVLHGGATRDHARFEREARLLAGLDHPGIVRYVAHGDAAGERPWLAMEWLDGEDLERRLSRGPLALAEALAIATGVAGALASAHARGVVHRDIKPSNVFLVGGDPAAIKVVDFGIALEGGAARATRTGMALGTAAYAAPEQARGQRDVGPRADVFSLGCVIFECLAGRLPFTGDHALAVVLKILLEDAPRLGALAPHVPPALDDLVARMLAKAKEARPADGAAVVAELAALALTGAGPLPPPPAPPAVGLGGGEQRHICLILLGAPETAGADDPLAATLAGDTAAPLHLLNGTSLTQGARVEPLLDGSAVLIMPAIGAATDQAGRAALCALALRAGAPEAPIAITTGRGDTGARLPVGDAIDRAARLLGAGRGAGEARAIRIDDVTAGLLDARFAVTGDSQGFALAGLREDEVARTVLGRPTPCVGRDAELGLLEALFAQCAAESVARAAIVIGPPGIGKSRLRQELLRRVAGRAERVTIWMGRSDPLAAGSAFGVVGEALRRTAGLLDGEPVAVRRQKLGARVGRHLEGAAWARVAAFLGEIVGAPLPAEDDPALAAARRDPVLMGDQIRRAFEDLVAAECAAGPVVLLLEDLHWGDVPSVALIDAALRLAERPLLVLAFARPEVSEVFPGLWAERDVQTIRLGGLTRRAGERLARSVLGEAASVAAVTRLVDRAAGNAFYLEELIRAEAAGHGESLPETVVAMVEARLTAMEPDARRALRAASVFGDVFWTGGVAALLGGERRLGEARAWLDELGRREVIGRRAGATIAGETEHAFGHALVREAAYAMLTEADRALGHRLAGEWLEGVGVTDAMTLAEHFERGGAPVRAAGHYRRAAEQALEGNDMRAALDRAERGVRCGAEGEALGLLRLVQAQAHRYLDSAAFGRSALEALALLPEGSAPWCAAASGAAVAHVQLGAMADLLALDERVWPPLVEAGSPAGQAAAADIVACLFVAGQTARGAARLDALDALERGGEGDPARWSDPIAATSLLRARAFGALSGGDLARYLEVMSSIAEARERAGDTRNACARRINVGDALNRMGAYARAEEVLRVALAAADGMGLPAPSAAAKVCLGWSLCHQGQLAEGRRLLVEAVAGLQARGDRRFEGSARAYLALGNALAGELDAAEREAREASRVLEGIGPLRPFALATLARVLLAQGRAVEALACAREAMEGLEPPHHVEEGEALVRLAAAEALEASGDPEGARRAIASARAELSARAQPISDVALRASFLENVPEHARTLALAAAWLGPP